jgi:hypothetical protein
MRTWRRGNALAVIACALLLSGCSGKGGQAVSSRHDSGIHLSPDPAFATSQISVVLENAWMDPGKCTFLWLRNNQEIPGATGPVLGTSSFGRGDKIGVVVGVPANGNEAPRKLRAEIGVSNSAPTVTHVTMSLNTASGKAEVQTTVEGVDPDQDRMDYTYQWFKNDAPIANATAASLPASAFTRGDQVAVEVVASDGTDKSPPFRSEPLALDNHPPQFTSQPGAPAPADSTFHYAAVATDPDGDKLRYELVTGPSGMTVDADGSVNWVLPPREQRRGEQPVVLRASDGAGGEATQQFTIPLDPRPARH